MNVQSIIESLMLICVGIACGVTVGSIITGRIWKGVESAGVAKEKELTTDLVDTRDKLNKAYSELALYEAGSINSRRKEQELIVQYRVLSEEWEKLEEEKKGQKAYEDLSKELENLNKENQNLTERIKNLVGKAEKYKKQSEDKDSMIMNLEMLVHELQIHIDGMSKTR